ncbi:MAG: radical SAM/SPASM domain-containing protein, partial [Bacteroidota bacterium]
MIELEQLYNAYDNDGFYSLQLEVGDRCFQGCIYCYMNAVEATTNILTDYQIYQVLQDASILNIKAIEWLGGEPLLRPGIFKFLKKSRELGLRNNMWTGGLPFKDKVIVKKTAKYCKEGLISIHLSTINSKTYKILHPNRDSDDINTIIDGLKHLLDIGYPAERILNSVTFTGLQSADDMIETMEYFNEKYGIKTSLNVYHTYLRPEYGKNDLLRFITNPKDVAKVYKSYKSILGAKELPMNCVNKQYCSTTLAVLNNGFVTPCATIREEKDECNLRFNNFINIVENNKEYLNFKLFKDKDNLPVKCKKCKLN